MQFYSRLRTWIAFELRSDRENQGASFGKSTTALGGGAAEGRGGPVAANPQNGGRRSIDRRHRSRFQQPAHSNRRTPRNGARPHWRRSPHRCVVTGSPPCGGGGGGGGAPPRPPSSFCAGSDLH